MRENGQPEAPANGNCHSTAGNDITWFAAAAAKSLQSCPTLCDPIDVWQPTKLPRPWDSPGKNTGVGCHFLLQCMKGKSESEVAQSCSTLSDPMNCSLLGNAKECSNYRTIALISHTSKVTLKILQARPQQYVNFELPDVQAGFRKGRGTRDQIANSCWIIEKAREFQKISASALLTMPKPLTVWITINCGKF